MQLYFDPSAKAGVGSLPPEEARHAVQVMRHRVGDVLQLVDGRGGWYTATLLEVSKRSCTVSIAPVRQEPQRRPYRLTLAVAPTKSIDRLEWLLEKATELGVDTIVPLHCEHSERKQLRPERLTKVLVAAMKQSQRAWLPELKPLTKFSDWIGQSPAGARYIAWIDPQVNNLLSRDYRAGQDACVLIGPEGDFSSEEVAAARAAGYQAVSLGDYRLRTETAGLVALHTLVLINEMNDQ